MICSSKDQTRPRKQSLALVLFTALTTLLVALPYAIHETRAQSLDSASDTIYLPIIQTPSMQPSPVRFAVIGDYGVPNQAAQDVADLVASWNPDFIITTGDNNYPAGEASTIDRNIGAYYHAFIAPYYGQYGAGSTTNRFFPSLGNHDWDADAVPYLDYFTLPGNERYYELVRGPVQLFALDSDPREPDGVTATSSQASWLREAMANSTACWQVVYMHHPPFSSGPHGSSDWMQWPYRAWGADIVFAGHDHTYERLLRDGIPYIVNGLGGNVVYSFSEPVDGSAARYNADVGAVLVEATNTDMTVRFMTRAGSVIDTYRINKPCP